MIVRLGGTPPAVAMLRLAAVTRALTAREAAKKQRVAPHYRRARPRLRALATATDALRPQIVAAIDEMRAPIVAWLDAHAARESVREAAPEGSLIDELMKAIEHLSPENLRAVLEQVAGELYKHGLGIAIGEVEAPDDYSQPATSAIDAIADATWKLAKSVRDDEVAAIKALVRDALAQGVSIPALSSEIRDFMADGVHRIDANGVTHAIDVDTWANTVARTETARAQNAGHLDAYKALRVAQVRWIAAEDERTCPVCMALDGTIADVGSLFDGVDVEAPPEHPNCFPAATRVRVAGLLRGAILRQYVGEMVVVSFADGEDLTGTPNHPVATRRGWVPLAELQRGDEVLHYARGEGTPDVDDVELSIEQHFESLPMSFRSMPGSTEDFHGDGTDNEVHIVRADRDLAPIGESRFLEQRCEHGLVLARRSPQRLRLDAIGASTQIAERPPRSAHGDVGGHSIPAVLLGVTRAHHQPIRPNGIPNVRADLDQTAADGRASDPERGRERVLALAGGIASRQVLGVDRVPFHGPVFNLETTAGWYVANGVIASNCRCTVVAVRNPDGTAIKTDDEYDTTEAGPPDEPRDDHGRWTTGGSAGVPAGVSAYPKGKRKSDYAPKAPAAPSTAPAAAAPGGAPDPARVYHFDKTKAEPLLQGVTANWVPVSSPEMEDLIKTEAANALALSPYMPEKLNALGTSESILDSGRPMSNYAGLTINQQNIVMVREAGLASYKIETTVPGRYTTDLGSNARGVVDHEMGHVLYFNMPAEQRTAWKAMYNSRSPSDIEAAKRFSLYGSQSPEELFAETFAAHVRSHPYPAKYAPFMQHQNVATLKEADAPSWEDPAADVLAIIDDFVGGKATIIYKPKPKPRGSKEAGPPDEARDERGRWTGGGGGSNVSPLVQKPGGRAGKIAATTATIPEIGKVKVKVFSGELLHGTTAEAAASIKKNGFEPSISGLYGAGAYFSDNATVAKGYARGDDANVIKVRAEKLKLLDVKDYGEYTFLANKAHNSAPPAEKYEYGDEEMLHRVLAKHGYDGIYVQNPDLNSGQPELRNAHFQVIFNPDKVSVEAARGRSGRLVYVFPASLHKVKAKKAK